MQKEKPDSAKAALGMPMYTHTPMMPQYRRATFLLAIFFGNSPKPSKKSVDQSHPSAQ